MAEKALTITYDDDYRIREIIGSDALDALVDAFGPDIEIGDLTIPAIQFTVRIEADVS
jgi:hypothetical protein